MKKIAVIALLFISCFLVFAVSDYFIYVKEPEKLPIPDITTFSDIELEERENKLPELDKAVLYSDGTRQDISKDDKRLIRLLNFCTYSMDNGFSMWSGAVDYNENKKYIESGNRLEIFFKGVENTSGKLELMFYDRFVIKENEVWLLQSDPKYDLFQEGNTIGATVWYPYAARTEGYADLDFLVEAGFLK